jgi:peptide/nickel transport system substrate-binding protein
MAYTIPRRQILEDFYNGYGNLGGSVIAPANKFWTDPSIKPYPFDLEKAREILKEAGYRWDSQGRLCYPAE